MSESGHDSKLVEELRRLLLAIEASGRAVLPRSNDELLQSIVEAAARIFGAAAASIALVNEKEAWLEFKVAHGAGSDEVVGMRMPLDEGIAGYVVMTGQPMAISNVQQDTRFARTTAERTGYVPRSILAMPLLWRDRVIGVMEVLDKIAAPAFGMQDMELLALFARQAAIAIHQSQQFDQLNELLVRGIHDLLACEGIEFSEIAHAVRAEPDDATARDLFELADRVNAISALGDAERQTCLRVLDAFAEHSKRGQVSSDR
ncbi:MAG: GAF domain-containing protein [Chloroflexi bacterium]|nr:GAF domain-containing protein [Chloroflexota bacterium]